MGKNNLETNVVKRIPISYPRFKCYYWEHVGNRAKSDIQKNLSIIKHCALRSSSSCWDINQMLTGQKWFRLNCIHAENEVYWVKIMTLSHQDNITSSILYFQSGILNTTSWFMKCRGENKNFMWEQIVFEQTKRWAFFVSSPFVEILFIFHNFAPAQIGTKSGPVGKMRTNLWQGANIFIILTGLASLWETPSLMSYNIWVISFIWVLLRTLCARNIWCAGWK